jgi:CxxC motif-containing protein (DUF1111 family)
MNRNERVVTTRWSAHLRVLVIAACTVIAGCGGGGGKSSGDSGSGGDGATGAAPPASSSSSVDSGTGSGSAGSGSTGGGSGSAGGGSGSGSAGGGGGGVTALGYTPLTYPQTNPSTQYSLADGTLVTQIGGRVRDRHAREQPDSPGTGDPYDLFAAHYFERRTHQVTIYDNVSPTNPQNHVLTVVVRPQWWLYGTNFRSGFIGRRDGDPIGPAAVALYGDNGGMKRLPIGALLSNQELKTPYAGYDALPGDPNSNYDTDLTVPPKDGEFVLVKQITASASLKRNLQAGDLIEFELGIFLAGNQGDALGRFNYYSDIVVYQVGSAGAHAWFRGASSDPALIPWDSHLIPTEALAGGSLMTLQEDTSNQPEMNLLQAGTNIAGINIQPFQEGRRLFHTSFLTGSHAEAGNPVFTAEAGKAGPKFQQPSCIACHTNDGKSSPTQGTPLNTMVVLTGDSDAKGNPIPDTRFGGHLEQGLVTDGGKTYDGRQALLTIASYKSTAGSYPDGTAYTLQTPQYALTDTSGKTLDMPAHLSVRTAPHLVGMGLLEAVPESSLEALATASAADPDKAVGKLQIITDLKDPTIKRVGRFGWRATSSTVAEQTAAALNGDIGVTTSLIPKHLCGLATAAADCRAADAAGPELNDSDLDLIVRYLSLLAVPPARHFAGEQPLAVSATTILAQTAAQTAAQVTAEQTLQARVAAGKNLFAQARCTACHVASLTTGTSHRFAELRGQTIAPYTDLLLHDMGPDLADTFPQGNATQQEWRTAPLWGLGLLQSINPNVRFLHDGRARTVEEAILWHGGQAAASRDRFKALAADDRQKVIDMVMSR